MSIQASSEPRRVDQPANHALVPLDRLCIPAEIDGRAGLFRAPRKHCRLEADTDHEAVLAWLASKRGGEGATPSATQRAYRKEVERVLLWASVIRRLPISSMTVDDAAEYLAFLQSPPDSWCGPRHRQRHSPDWRPLEGPLSLGARRQAAAVLRSLFKFLRIRGYVVGNPFETVDLFPGEAGETAADRALTFSQWQFIAAHVAQDHAPAARRRARAIHWLYATGLRVSELCAARCADLEQHVYRDAQGHEASGWLLEVEGHHGANGRKGRARKVPVPAALVDELAIALSLAGFGGSLDAAETRDIPILANLEEGLSDPLTASGLYKAIKTVFARCAQQLDDHDPLQAEHLRKASPHWLRHSHGRHALQGGPDGTGVALQVVQSNLGHRSIATTAKYLRRAEESSLQAMASYWASKPR